LGVKARGSRSQKVMPSVFSMSMVLMVCLRGGGIAQAKAPAAFGATTTDQRKGLTSNEKAHS
jgi:hypothetical protein